MEGYISEQVSLKRTGC